MDAAFDDDDAENAVTSFTTLMIVLIGQSARVTAMNGIVYHISTGTSERTSRPPLFRCLNRSYYRYLYVNKDPFTTGFQIYFVAKFFNAKILLLRKPTTNHADAYFNDLQIF